MTTSYVMQLPDGMPDQQPPINWQDQLPPDTDTIIVLVPSSRVLLTTASIPETSQSRLLQAIPYALEDQLIENIEHLHFAIGERSNGDIHVAIINKAYLQAWLTTLADQEIEPTYLIPEVLVLPWQPMHWTVFISDSTVLVRTAQQNGFICETNNLSMHIHNAYAASADNVPSHLDIYDPNKLFDADSLQDLDIDTSIHPQTIDLLDTAKQTIDQQSLNLLQGEFKPKSTRYALPSQWRLPIWLASGLFGVIILGQIISFIYLSIVNNVQEKRVVQLFQSVYPEATTTTDIKPRLSRELDLLTQAAAGSPFLKSLASAANVLHKQTNIRIQTINFRNKRLTIKLSAVNFQSLQTILQQLKSQGLNVKQSAAATAGKRVIAEYEIITP